MGRWSRPHDEHAPPAPQERLSAVVADFLTVPPPSNERANSAAAAVPSALTGIMSSMTSFIGGGVSLASLASFVSTVPPAGADATGGGGGGGGAPPEGYARAGAGGTYGGISSSSGGGSSARGSGGGGGDGYAFRGPGGSAYR